MRTLERILTFVWQRPYVLPWSVYWLALPVLVTGSLLIPVGGIGLLILVGLVVAAVLGIVRWRVERRRCRATMIVPRFEEGAGAEGRGAEVQNLIVTDLRSNLPVELRGLVQPIPLTIDSSQDELAARIQKRLRAGWVLYGRCASREDGGWSVYPHILEPATESQTHLDLFTRDTTPANNLRFGPIQTSLPEQIGVRDEAFPLDFCRDLEAVLRGITGVVAEMFHADEKALELLDDALAVAGDSPNHQIDQLRISRAKVLRRLDKEDEAISYLRSRLDLPRPSPELLRTLAMFLFLRSTDLAEAGRLAKSRTVGKEGLAVLRRALEYEDDPQRDMTRYNIFTHLDPRLREDQAEYDEILDHLLRSPSGYQRQWYIKLAAAMRAWSKFEAAQGREDRAGVRHWSRVAATWYGRTLKARPKIVIDRVSWRPPLVRYTRYQRSAIIYANARDAHHWAGHELRKRWYEWRFQRIRVRLLKRGERAMFRADWLAAHAYFDWAVVGRKDQREAFALTYSACMWWKSGEKEKGEAEWQNARRRGPDALIARANLVHRLKETGLDASVPGDEPTDTDGVSEIIARDYKNWNFDPKWGFLPPGPEEE